MSDYSISEHHDALPPTPPGGYPFYPPSSQPQEPGPPFNLTEAVWERRAEYTKPCTVKIKVGTWNVAALDDTTRDIGKWFCESQVNESVALSGTSKQTQDHLKASKNNDHVRPREAVVKSEEIGLYALGLQEIVDISSPTELFNPYVDPGPAEKWKHVVAQALPDGYQLVAEVQLVGLYLMIYASPTVVPLVSSVDVKSVKTGSKGWAGNKGAVSARLVLGQTAKLAFVNCHLTAGATQADFDGRNWDVGQILHRTKFSGLQYGTVPRAKWAEYIGDEDLCFWFGDLNYRLDSIPGEDVRRLLALHTNPQIHKAVEEPEIIHPVASPVPSQNLSAERNSNDSATAFSNSSDGYESATSTMSSLVLVDNEQVSDDAHLDPESVQTTIQSLLSHDQLKELVDHNSTFYGNWKEGSIRFLPTYKYDIGTLATFDSSDKKRGPSWCDRIIYRTKEDFVAFNTGKRTLKSTADKGKTGSGSSTDNHVLFEYDPEQDGADTGIDEVGPTKDIEKFDRLDIQQDTYQSHQNIVSSDHKPLAGTFTLTFGAVDDDSKAELRTHMAKDLDKQENESRPKVTIYDEDTNEEIQEVEFGLIRYDEPEDRVITVANTGLEAAVIEILKDNGPGVTPSQWLSIRYDHIGDPTVREFFLHPGDKVALRIKVHVTDFSLVSKLNRGVVSLSNVQVLRLYHGRDYFIMTTALWAGSCFGRSLSDSPSPSPRAGAFTDSKPYRGLATYLVGLVQKAIAEAEMKCEQGPWETEPRWPFKGDIKAANKRKGVQALLRRNFEKKSTLSDGIPAHTDTILQVEATAQLFILSLQGLNDGVIPEDLWHSLYFDLHVHRWKSPIDAQDEQLYIGSLMSNFPVHSSLFTTITSSLIKIANDLAPPPAIRHDKTLTAYEHLFADILFRDPFHDNPKKSKESKRLRRHIVRAFLSVDDV